MTVPSLSLEQFRSYDKRSFRFADGVTIIRGANAAGKTNLFEALMMLATGRSFRAGVEREMIRWGSELARIRSDAGDDTVEILLTTGSVGGKPAPRKKFLVNGVSRRMIDVAGRIRAVLFWPEDLDIVTGSPGTRRRYLDTVLIQSDREYRRNLLSYERGLRQRNRLLSQINEGNASRSQLLFWDQLLIKTGGYITDARASYLAFVNGTTLADHRFLTEYDKSVISVARLEQYKDEEVAAKTTLVGPHRDDFGMLSLSHGSGDVPGGRNLGTYGSRGEQRLGVLWLKLAELSYIERVTGNRPLLLLDDIFSELDDEHRTLVGEVVGAQQTIITSADMTSVPEPLKAGSSVISL